MTTGTGIVIGYILRCSRCGWQRRYPFRPAWQNWRDCTFCGHRGTISMTVERNDR